MRSDTKSAFIKKIQMRFWHEMPLIHIHTRLNHQKVTTYQTAYKIP